MNLELKLEPLDIPGVEKGQPLIISGPCSAETEDQVLETGRKIAKMGIPIYRAGIWKPRTRPGGFEGLGVLALPWLQKLKAETGLLMASEVGNIYHLKEALQHGVDILWIGARTTSNPFMVQELADYMSGKDLKVFVKNPINPDLSLWIGALERLNKAGITKLAAIHRGFSQYDSSPYRNNPQWQIPIELKRRFPELPIIVDPSHICGRRDLLKPVCQKAADLNFDGLFIESHIDPEHALSDKDQQVTPESLNDILTALIWRKPVVSSEKMKTTLEALRAEIDHLDDEIMRIFDSRMQVADKIGLLKKENNITILQATRWSDILDTRMKFALEKGLSKDFVMNIFKAVHQESINRQTKVMNQEN